MASKKVTRRVGQSQSETAAELHRRRAVEDLQILEGIAERARQALRRKRDEIAPKFTLEDAFECDPSDYVGDIVKGTLSVSYLLGSISEIGNRNVDGRIAQGLAIALQHYAGDIRAYLKARAGGDDHAE